MKDATLKGLLTAIQMRSYLLVTIANKVLVESFSAQSITVQAP
jgi:hypothetical protein